MIKDGLEKFESQLIEFQAGESSKSLENCEAAWTTLLDNKVDRNSLLINLGGGMICDLGGYIASVYKRGIDFIHIPTSLLAQCDAAVGGKVAVNFKDHKNVIGLFNPPEAVFIHEPFLNTLPEEELLNGYAEVIKHGLLAGGEFWEQLKTSNKPVPGELKEMIQQSIDIKLNIVDADPYEQNVRKVLNLGHTLGHALESLALKDNKQLKHGKAVAIGLLIEGLLAVEKVGLPKEDVDDLAELVKKYFDTFHISDDEFPFLWDVMINDKKNTEGRVSFSLIDKPGNPVTDIFFDKEEVQRAIATYHELYGV